MSANGPLMAWLYAAMPRHVSAFLPSRRWFAGKARHIEFVELEDAVPCGDGDETCALVIVGVRYAGGTRERYVLLMTLVGQDGELPVIGPCDAGVDGTFVAEAMTDAGAARLLLRGFGTSQALPSLHRGALRYADAGADVERSFAAIDEQGGVVPVGAEQSNTSLRVGQNLVFKLFRKLDEGENPELEVGRFLAARTSFRATPMLQGSLTYTSPGGVASTVGVLQNWVDNRGDGWRYVVDELRQADGSTASQSLLADLRGLGAITADFHLALAGDSDVAAFAPEPVTTMDTDSWQSALDVRAANTLELLTRHLGAWPDESRQLAQSLMGVLRHKRLPRVPGVNAPSAQFRKIRVHGDYHLGQTLRTADGFLIIDLEGEPGRPLHERRLKHCALKDVAGMIRSLDYAVETVRRDVPHLSGDGTRASLRDAFLAGYLASGGARQQVYRPADRGAVDRWVDFFEIDKALYELEYEINNRPAWVHIPLRGILRILEARG